jgi:response regulator RpfG family c-di-GMP phosphodiesterase
MSEYNEILLRLDNINGVVSDVKEFISEHTKEHKQQSDKCSLHSSQIDVLKLEVQNTKTTVQDLKNTTNEAVKALGATTTKAIEDLSQTTKERIEEVETTANEKFKELFGSRKALVVLVVVGILVPVVLYLVQKT